MSTTTIGAATILVTALSLQAQSLAPGHLVGWAANTGPLAVCSAVYTQDIRGGCKKAVFHGSSLCTVKGRGGGGTAYDPRMQAAWVSNGAELALHDLSTNKVICRVPATLAGRGYAVSGLALSDSRRELFQLEMGPQILVISSYDVSTACKPVHKKNGCRVKINGTGAAALGLAYDEARDLLYYSTSISGFAGWTNTLHVVARGAPCVNLTTIPIKFCGNRPGSPVSGLAYDSCSQLLYTTGGREVRTYLLIDPAKGRVTDLTGAGACCRFTGNGAWAGLAVVPNWRSKTVGKSCVDRACGNCNAMQLGLIGGDASLGNRDFGFRLDNAPTASQGLFYVALGNCTAGVRIPGLCGPIYTPFTAGGPLLVGSFQVPGVGPCTGRATVVTGVPADPALCKVSLCTQWIVVCATGGIWSGVTNAVEFTIGG